MFRLAAEGAGKLLHADVAIGGHDDTDWLAVHFRHQRLQHAMRLFAEPLGGLEADAFGIRIIVVTMHRETDTGFGKNLRGARRLGHIIFRIPPRSSQA